jgi:predicted RNase H-like HicB family nuclease
MGMSRNLTAAVHQEEDWYVAQCLEVDVASQGRTIEEALGNLAEAVALYLEEVDDPQQHVTPTPLVTSFQVPGAAWALRSLTYRSARSPVFSSR